MLRTVLASTLLLLVTLAAVGCGGGASREDFEAQVRESRDRTDAALENVTRAETWDDLLDRLSAAGDEARSAADDLEQVEAPDEFEEGADELVEALRALGEEVSATAQALDESGLESPVQGLEFENWERVQSVLGELRERGIDVPPLERHGAGA